MDGRRFTDYAVLFDPPEPVKPTVYAEEENEEVRKNVEEKARERIKRQREEGVDVAGKYAGGEAQSGHDLRLKEDV
jgi:hypothetical protein